MFGRKTIPFAVDSRWFQGSTKIVTYELEELLGTKLRALLLVTMNSDESPRIDVAPQVKTSSSACELLECLAVLAGKNPAPSENNYAGETVSPNAAQTTPVKSRHTSAKEGESCSCGHHQD